MKLSLQKYAFALLASLALVSCAKDYALVGTEREKGREPIWLSTSVTVQNTRAAGAVSNDAISPTADDWDSRIVSLRMIISDSQTGIIVYNEKVDNSSELTDRFTQISGEQSRWRRPIKILPGIYDFWFIANEGANWYAPVQANKDGASSLGNTMFNKLTVGSNIQRIFDGKFGAGENAESPLAHLDFAPYRKYDNRQYRWVPYADTNSKLWENWSNNRPMPMSAVYKNIEINITRNNKGTSEADPQHFIAGGDEKVKLVRCMAKVTINVEKAAHVNTDKRVDYLQWPALGKFAITLLNRPRYWSFFNTPLFDMNHMPRQFKFYSDIFPDDQSRYRAVVINHGGNSVPESYGGIVYDSPSSSEADLKRYSYSFYVPELLLPKHPLDGEPNGGLAYDRLNAVMLAFSAPGRGFSVKVNGKNNDFFNVDPGADESVNYYPYSNKAAFEAVLDDSKAFNLGTADLEEANLNTENTRLPNPQMYSKFSLLRNRHYIYTIRMKDHLQVDVRIAPWGEEKNLGLSQVFNWVQVNVEDPTFTAANKQTKLRIQNLLQTTGDTYEWAEISIVDQNGNPNTQAYFTDYGKLAKLADRGGRATKLKFGNIPNTSHNAEQGFADFIVNWSGATGANAPAVGKSFIKIEYFKTQSGQKVPAGNRFGENSSQIVVRTANWKQTFDDLPN